MACWLKPSHTASSLPSLTKTNIAPKNGVGLFSGAMLVSGRVIFFWGEERILPNKKIPKMVQNSLG